MLRMGLVLVVLTIAMDPFSQQLLQLRQRMEWTKGDNPSVENTEKSAKLFWSWSYEREAGNPSDAISLAGHTPPNTPVTFPQIDLSMEAAIINALGQSDDSSVQRSLAVCPTGNCTWPTIRTLGVCSRCNNLTSQLQRVDGFAGFFRTMLNGTLRSNDKMENATAYMLLRGHFLPNIDGCVAARLHGCTPRSALVPDLPYDLTAFSTADWNKSITLRDVNTLITSMSAIYIDREAVRRQQEEEKDAEDQSKKKWPSTPVAALECGLYFCVKEITEARMEQNELFETVKEAEHWSPVHTAAEIRLSEPSEGFYTLEYNRSNTDADNENHKLVINSTAPEGETESWEVTADTYQAMSHFFNETFTRRWDKQSIEADLLEIAKKIDNNIEHMFNAAIMGESYLLPKRLDAIWNSSLPLERELEMKFERMATGMTNDMRRQVSSGSRAYTSGRIGVFEIAYSVGWPWFALHTAIIGGSAIFCVTTMAVSRSVPVWKSHSLATMSQSATIVDFGPEAKSLVELENRAKNVQVSLAGGEKGQLLRRRDDSSTRDDASSREENVGVSTGVPSLSQ